MRTLAAMALIVACSVAANGRADQNEVIWNQFTTDLMAGRVTPDRIHPYFPENREPLMRILEHFRQSSRPEDWKEKPELYRVGNQIHGIISLTEADGKKVPYCFTLLVENSQWYFQHVESIFIRLDQIGPLPASHFPDVSEAQKAWMRDEWRVTEEIKVFNLLAKEKGRDFALDFFHDGVGYSLQARTWVPFVSPTRAFVLFLCWEQANLFASPVALQALDDNSAVIQLQPRWFQLYRETTHLAQMISEAEYRNLFETIWHDRARAAGWNLQIDYAQDQVVFRLKR